MKGLRSFQAESEAQKKIISQKINKNVMDDWLSACRDFKILNTSLESNLKSLKESQLKTKKNVNIEPFLKPINDVIKDVFCDIPEDIHSIAFGKEKESREMSLHNLKRHMNNLLGNSSIANNDQMKQGGDLLEEIRGNSSNCLELVAEAKQKIQTIKYFFVVKNF